MSKTGQDFIRLSSATFKMGADTSPHLEDGEGPSRRITIDAFALADTTVSNFEFGRFIAETGYTTTAERAGGSLVFSGMLDHPSDHKIVTSETPWWLWVKGANWRRPNGHKNALPDHPVVQVSRDDARAYCHWASVGLTGIRLPTEAEWEYAAQENSDDQASVQAHIFKGGFPDAPTGPVQTRPVHDGNMNSKGFHHMCGNVWEWTNDRFTRLHSPRPANNPRGPLNGSSFVVKGGSFLCHPSYCARFRPSSRRGEHAQATACNMGFRVAAKY